MTARTDYIAHCESLGIHRSLSKLMADVPKCSHHDTLSETAAAQVLYTLHWAGSEQGHDFWASVFDMLSQMAKTGECK